MKTAITEMLSGAFVKVQVKFFQNDIVSFANKDDVLTYLIHLGYLGYEQNKQAVFIPSEEIRQELTVAIESTKWNEFYTFQQESADLLVQIMNYEPSLGLCTCCKIRKKADILPRVNPAIRRRRTFNGRIQ